MQLRPGFAITLNALALYALSGLLAAAFVWQFALDELPCPLCLLQRVAFTALAIGPVLNIVRGPQPRNYGLVIIAAVFGAIVSGRQVLLHIVPGDPGFGSPVLGLHLYTWAFVVFAAAIVASAVMLMLPAQFEGEKRDARLSWFAQGAVYLIITLTLLNAFSAFAQCGLQSCPGDPVRYELFS